MNVRLTSVLSIAIFSSVLAAACGGGAPDAQAPTGAPSAAAPTASAPVAPPATTAAPEKPAPTATAAAPVEPPPPPPPAKTWKETTSQDTKVAFMKTAIAPPMAKVFQEHNAKKYADFGCASCHGAKHVTPKDFLPKLTMKGGKFVGVKPDMMKFMGSKVVPAMAAAMGEQPFDPATKTGFGCGGCHAIDMK